MNLEVLDEATWQARAAAHAARVDTFVAPHLARREAKVKHPVHDFLFTYYSQRPAQLRRWHPGYGVGLGGDAASYASLKGYAAHDGAVTVTQEYVASTSTLLTNLRTLLTATAARPANLGCFGLHEWAMVYRLTEEQTRHADWPLRLGPDGTDQVVESHRIGCSHFDAFRFFTEPARPLNTLSPASDDRPAFEQPGCLHAGMDLYKHAFRLTPMICSGSGRRLLRAGPRHPGARHARGAVRPQRAGPGAGADRDGRGQAGLRSCSTRVRRARCPAAPAADRGVRSAARGRGLGWPA